MISVVVYITMERQANTLAYIVGLGRRDPLSPHLFIIALDILARIIAQDDKIKAFKISSKEIKMTQSADDLTKILSDSNSITEVLSLLTKFGDYSVCMNNLAPNYLSELITPHNQDHYPTKGKFQHCYSNPPIIYFQEKIIWRTLFYVCCPRMEQTSS